MSFIPALGKHRLEGHCKFKANLVYWANSRQSGLYSETLLSSNTERMSLLIIPALSGKAEKINHNTAALHGSDLISCSCLIQIPLVCSHTDLATGYPLNHVPHSLLLSDHLPHNSYQLLWSSGIKHKWSISLGLAKKTDGLSLHPSGSLSPF